MATASVVVVCMRPQPAAFVAESVLVIGIQLVVFVEM
jgi:hypothetical protein